MFQVGWDNYYIEFLVFHVTVVASGHGKFVDSFSRLKSDIFLYGKHSAALMTYSRVDRKNLDILRGTFKKKPIPNRFCMIFFRPISLLDKQCVFCVQEPMFGCWGETFVHLNNNRITQTWCETWYFQTVNSLWPCWGCWCVTLEHQTYLTPAYYWKRCLSQLLCWLLANFFVISLVYLLDVWFRN